MNSLSDAARGRCGLRDLSAVVGGGPKLVAPRAEAFSAASRYTLLLYGLSFLRKKARLAIKSTRV